MLGELVAAADAIAGIARHTGRTRARCDHLSMQLGARLTEGAPPSRCVRPGRKA